MTTPNEKLIMARLKHRWSVAVASQRAGVSVNTFNRWERGLQVPQLATLDQLCKAFDMSADELGFGFVTSPHKDLRTGLPMTQAETPPIGSSQSPQTEMLAATPTSSNLIRGPTCCPLSPLLLPPYMDVQGLYGSVDSVIRSSEAMNQARKQWESGERFSRRQAIAALIGTPAAVFGLKSSGVPSLLHTEEILTLCATHIPLCWQLYFEGGLAEVQRVLPDYVSQLSALAQQPSIYQRRAAAQASQVSQLASLIALQRQDYGAAHLHANQAFVFGELAEDPNLQTAALIRQALVYFYLKRTLPRLQTYQKALQFSQHATPLLQGRVYSGLMEASSALEQEHDALQFRDLALSAYPENVETDPSFPYTHFKPFAATAFEGLMYLNLNQPQRAWEVLERSRQTIPLGLTPNRVEFAVRQVSTAYALGDLDQTCACIESAATMALALGSQLRLDETYEVYEHLHQQWRHESRVKALEEIFL